MAYLLYLVLSVLISNIDATIEYKVASFEHVPYFIHDGLTPTRQESLWRMRVNTAIYNEQASSSSKQGAQIIIFPEDGLYGMFYMRDEIQPYLEPIPDVLSSKPWVPCTDPGKVLNTEILHELSCIALNNSIALVANMGEIKYCTRSKDPNCPADGRYQYNTDVVFDTDGQFIAKYHKQNLYHEDQFNTPIICEFVTFVTSFDVRFGIFTCFDLLFKSPAVDLVEKYGIWNIIVPLAWYHGYPLLKSIQFHQAWSRTHCVNLITANLFVPIFGFTGSGIYSCGEVHAYTYGDVLSKNRLLISTLTDFENDTFLRMRKSKKYEINQEYNEETFDSNQVKFLETRKTFQARLGHNLYTLTKLTTTQDRISICADELCCNLDYKISGDFSESFAFGTFRGNDEVDGYFLEMCVLFKCYSNDDQSCGKEVEESQTMFQSFQMAGNFSANTTIYPGVLSSGDKLSQPDVVKFTGNIISSENFDQELLTAVLLGRVYSKDKPGEK